jgi:hypothetical protein
MGRGRLPKVKQVLAANYHWQKYEAVVPNPTRN